MRNAIVTHKAEPITNPKHQSTTGLSSFQELEVLRLQEFPGHLVSQQHLYKHYSHGCVFLQQCTCFPNVSAEKATQTIPSVQQMANGKANIFLWKLVAFNNGHFQQSKQISIWFFNLIFLYSVRECIICY